MGLERVAVNYHVLQSGERSSLPHAHSDQEELVIVLGGNPLLWLDGKTYELDEGDVICLKPGTGSAHSFINNAPARAYLLVVGEQDSSQDKVHYPMNPEVNQAASKQRTYWEDAPERSIGKENPKPRPHYHNRQNKRLDACFSVRFTSETHDFEAWCLDVSRGGMFLKTQGFLPEMSEKIAFKLDLTTGQRKSIHGVCQIRWIRETAQSLEELRGFGVQFLNLTPSS